ncbi:hypothetical protein TRAPUB_9459 [Trametes pubescens]|uniref:Yeast cell wall synthesis Kre9/Knh1-like N-terminal domain-containing protein n=1 Tax=Trametes pubescens TaxID=154538 RepID=A0A1M2W273_TRAPU|nr:hypothetical protein TRAPUB_9459 [Trametes pubescens]
MMFTFGQLSVFTFLLSLFAVVSALPLALRDVFVPPVTYPHAGTVWKVGQHHNVTWDTTNAPVNITNKVGMIVLAKGGLLQDLANPLAKDFDILKGRFEIQVPNVTPGDDYTIVLFGDSGNDSANFTITA